MGLKGEVKEHENEGGDRTPFGTYTEGKLLLRLVETLGIDDRCLEGKELVPISSSPMSCY